MKKYLKKLLPDSKVPRQLDEIQKEYAEVSTKASMTQYQAFVHTESLRELNLKMVALNQEGHARRELDKASSNKDAQTAESPTVKS